MIIIFNMCKRFMIDQPCILQGAQLSLGKTGQKLQELQEFQLRKYRKNIGKSAIFGYFRVKIQEIQEAEKGYLKDDIYKQLFVRFFENFDIPFSENYKIEVLKCRNHDFKQKYEKYRTFFSIIQEIQDHSSKIQEEIQEIQEIQEKQEIQENWAP